MLPGYGLGFPPSAIPCKASTSCPFDSPLFQHPIFVLTLRLPFAYPFQIMSNLWLYGAKPKTNSMALIVSTTQGIGGVDLITPSGLGI